eukprot:4955165-Prymnesium_polylepis.2
MPLASAAQGATAPHLGIARLDGRHRLRVVRQGRHHFPRVLLALRRRHALLRVIRHPDRFDRPLALAVRVFGDLLREAAGGRRLAAREEAPVVAPRGGHLHLILQLLPPDLGLVHIVDLAAAHRLLVRLAAVGRRGVAARRVSEGRADPRRGGAAAGPEAREQHTNLRLGLPQRRWGGSVPEPHTHTC